MMTLTMPAAWTSDSSISIAMMCVILLGFCKQAREFFIQPVMTARRLAP